MVASNGEVYLLANHRPMDELLARRKEASRTCGGGSAYALIFAPKPASPALAVTGEPEATASDIPMDQIEPDPDQPRKVFEPTALRELAAFIRADGLLQPIVVRPPTTGRTPYMIAVGERRWRAHQINGAATIRAFVTKPKDTTTIRVMQIIENDQRQDVTPLEQARSYQALMDSTGWTVEELGARIGKAPHLITERTALLNLRPEYQALLASGNLKPSEATELVRLSPRGQDTLFNAIRTGWRRYNRRPSPRDRDGVRGCINRLRQHGHERDYPSAPSSLNSRGQDVSPSLARRAE